MLQESSLLENTTLLSTNTFFLMKLNSQRVEEEAEAPENNLFIFCPAKFFDAYCGIRGIQHQKII